MFRPNLSEFLHKQKVDSRPELPLEYQEKAYDPKWWLQIFESLSPESGWRNALEAPINHRKEPASGTAKPPSTELELLVGRQISPLTLKNKLFNAQVIAAAHTAANLTEPDSAGMRALSSAKEDGMESIVRAVNEILEAGELAFGSRPQLASAVAAVVVRENIPELISRWNAADSVDRRERVPALMRIVESSPAPHESSGRGFEPEAEEEEDALNVAIREAVLNYECEKVFNRNTGNCRKHEQY